MQPSIYGKQSVFIRLEILTERLRTGLKVSGTLAAWICEAVNSRIASLSRYPSTADSARPVSAEFVII